MSEGILSDPRVIRLKELYRDTEPRTMADPIDTLIGVVPTLEKEAYEAMWNLIDEVEKHRAQRNIQSGSADRLNNVRDAGNDAWERACQRYLRTGLGFLPEDGGYDRLWKMREIFLVVRDESKSSTRSFSHRYRLAQGMQLMAEIYGQDILKLERRAEENKRRKEAEAAGCQTPDGLAEQSLATPATASPFAATVTVPSPDAPTSHLHAKTAQASTSQPPASTQRSSPLGSSLGLYDVEAGRPAVAAQSPATPPAPPARDLAGMATEYPTPKSTPATNLRAERSSGGRTPSPASEAEPGPPATRQTKKPAAGHKLGARQHERAPQVPTRSGTADTVASYSTAIEPDDASFVTTPWEADAEEASPSPPDDAQRCGSPSPYTTGDDMSEGPPGSIPPSVRGSSPERGDRDSDADSDANDDVEDGADCDSDGEWIPPAKTSYPPIEDTPAEPPRPPQRRVEGVRYSGRLPQLFPAKPVKALPKAEADAANALARSMLGAAWSGHQTPSSSVLRIAEIPSLPDTLESSPPPVPAVSNLPAERAPSKKPASRGRSPAIAKERDSDEISVTSTIGWRETVELQPEPSPKEPVGTPELPTPGPSTLATPAASTLTKPSASAAAPSTESILNLLITRGRMSKSVADRGIRNFNFVPVDDNSGTAPQAATDTPAEVEADPPADAPADTPAHVDLLADDSSARFETAKSKALKEKYSHFAPKKEGDAPAPSTSGKRFQALGRVATGLRTGVRKASLLMAKKKRDKGKHAQDESAAVVEEELSD